MKFEVSREGAKSEGKGAIDLPISSLINWPVRNDEFF
jgi:hypothetical protein